MRMWFINPMLMCNKHLIGEHVEMHMFVGAIKKGKNINGYIKKNLVDVERIPFRHEQLVNEMLRRGMKHKTNINIDDFRKILAIYDFDRNIFNTFVFSKWKVSDKETFKYNNMKELSERCEECRKQIETVFDNVKGETHD